MHPTPLQASLHRQLVGTLYRPAAEGRAQGSEGGIRDLITARREVAQGGLPGRRRGAGIARLSHR